MVRSLVGLRLVAGTRTEERPVSAPDPSGVSPLDGTALLRHFGVAAAGSVCAVVPILRWIVRILVVMGLFVLWVLGLLAALRGDMRPVPVLGEQYQRWFAGALS
jgi:hypothetical protein